MVKKIVILMIALSRAGKTTKVATLSAFREKLSKLCIKSNATTPVTTDWELSVSAQDISLSNIELNLHAVYKDIYSRTVAKYNENLKDHPFFTEFFGLEKIMEDSGITDPKEYVDVKIKEFIENSDFTTIEKIMSNKAISNYVKRITVIVPASEEFKRQLESLGLDAVVLRDTRGIMDINPNDLAKMPHMSMYDLGLDGIDAVLLLCSTEEFPVQAGEWYKNIYGSCFRSVPVFLESRTDALHSSYAIHSDMMDIDPEGYLAMIKARKLKSFNDMMDTFFESGFNLLKTYGAVSNIFGKWQFEYSVFDMEDCLYLNSVVPSLKSASRSGCITNETFNNDSYQFFKNVTLHNMFNIVKRVKEHIELMDHINNQHVVSSMFLDFLERHFANNDAYMCPNYRYIERLTVCKDIITTTDFLGPRYGITTMNHGEPRYLAAATSAASSYNNIASVISRFKLGGAITDNAGIIVAPDINPYRQDALAHMYLNKKLTDAADVYASSFSGYVITDRDVVVDVIEMSRSKGLFHSGKDPLTIVTKEIAKRIFR